MKLASRYCQITTKRKEAGFWSQNRDLRDLNWYINTNKHTAAIFLKISLFDGHLEKHKNQEFHRNN